MKKGITSLPRSLCWWMTCFGVYVSPRIWSLKDSPSGTFEGIIQLISSPYAGQPTQPNSTRTNPLACNQIW